MATEGFEIDLNNIPQDPAEALKLLEQIEKHGNEPEAPAATEAPKALETPAPDVKAASEPSTETQNTTQQNEPEPAGVATKDGKHVIPYSVLTSTRERATRAEAAFNEMAERAAALEKSLAAVANGANPAAARAATAVTADAPAMSDADLEALKDDFPTVYKALQASMQRADRLESQLQEQAGFKQEIEAASQRSVEENVQDAIDSNPKLVHIQTNDPDAFALAQRFDDTLKELPAWKDKSMSERFAKVIEMVEQANGAIEVPGGKSKQQDPAANATDLKAQAKAAAAAAAKANTAANVPTSLSEFPVGEPAAQSEHQALEAMTHAQLAEKLNRMTPAQQEAYFASLG